MLEVKNTVREMKGALGRLTGRLGTAEERISARVAISIETSRTEKQREQRLKKKKKPEQIIQGLLDNHRRTALCVMRTPEGEERNRRNI